MYSEPCQTSKLELFVKIVNGFQPLTILEINFNLDVLQGPKFDSEKYKKAPLHCRSKTIRECFELMQGSIPNFEELQSNMK